MPSVVTVALPRYVQCNVQNNYDDYYPFVEKLLKFACESRASRILHYFSRQFCHQLPIAPITGLADGLDTKEGYWLRADPIEIRQEAKGACFYGSRYLDMNLTQAQHIANDLQAIVRDYGYELFVPYPYRWYIKLSHEVDLTTASPEVMLGQPLANDVKSNNKKVQALWMEIKTHLKACPINLGLKREISNLWLWGGGRLPDLSQLTWQRICGDGPISRGIAEILQVPFCNKLHKVVAEAQSSENDLIVVNELYDIERLVLLPLYKQLRRRQLSCLNLYLSEETLYQIDAEHIPIWWKFWRK